MSIVVFDISPIDFDILFRCEEDVIHVKLHKNIVSHESFTRFSASFDNIPQFSLISNLIFTEINQKLLEEQILGQVMIQVFPIGSH